MVFLLYSLGYLLIHFFLLSVLILIGKNIEYSFTFYINNSVSFDFSLLGDYIRLGFLCFVSLITFRVIKYRGIYIGLNISSKRFIVLVSFFVLSIFILILSPNFLIIILGWDGLGVTSFLLVIYYNNYSALCSGLTTIYLNRIGDFFIIFSFWLLYKNIFGNTYSIFLGERISILFFCILFASITKSAQLPFSSWLPAAIAAPTPVSSLVHSSTLVTAGVYVIIRFFYLTERIILASSLLWIRVLTCLGAGIVACYENDLKKLVAISTLSQLGLIIFSYSLGEAFYSFYHMVCHALFKALLFLGCGFCIINIYGLQDSRGLLKLGVLIYGNLILICIAVISLIGFPFIAGFYSKDSIIEIRLLLNSPFIINITLIFCCVLTGLYGIKGLILIMKGNNYGNLNFLGAFSLKLSLGIIILSLWSIFLGKFYFYIIKNLEGILINMFLKLLGILIVVLGIILALKLF